MLHLLKMRSPTNITKLTPVYHAFHFELKSYRHAYPHQSTPNLSTQSFFLDHPRTYSSTSHKTNLQSKSSTSTMRITIPNQLPHMRLQSIDISQTFSNTLCNFSSSTVTTECCCETIAKSLVGECGRDRDTEYGT
jgi:hypothetical protein